MATRSLGRYCPPTLRLSEDFRLRQEALDTQAVVHVHNPDTSDESAALCTAPSLNFLFNCSSLNPTNLSARSALHGQSRAMSLVDCYVTWRSPLLNHWITSGLRCGVYEAVKNGELGVIWSPSPLLANLARSPTRWLLYALRVVDLIFPPIRDFLTALNRSPTPTH